MIDTSYDMLYFRVSKPDAGTEDGEPEVEIDKEDDEPDIEMDKDNQEETHLQTQVFILIDIIKDILLKLSRKLDLLD